MAVTVANIISNLDTFIGDSSTDRISQAERFQYITEATVWLQEELQNDVQNQTYTLNYFDSVHYYKVTSAIADLLMGADLRRAEDDQNQTFAHKSARELAEEIGSEFPESSWGIERRDGNTYLVVNHQSKYLPLRVVSCDSLTENGSWAVDSTNSDATNLTIDSVELKQGAGSFNFDLDVSQSGNNKAELVNTTMSGNDWSELEDLGSFIFWAYIPDSTYTSSYTLYWGSDTSNYWSATVTTDITGSAFVDGWNRVKVNWADATATGSPDATDITYMQIDLNYNASQGDDTDYRIDDIILVRPEVLTFHYIGWNVGTDTNGTDITAFSATTDIPYFSGMYDQYKYAVAHKAASLIFQSFRLLQESREEHAEALRIIDKAKDIIPKSKNPEIKSFKVRGVRFNSPGIRRRR